MGWSIGFDNNWNRDIGYGVPAICDYPECNEKIDRGLSYVCGGDPYGGEDGCGLFFCNKHLAIENEHQQCKRCIDGEEPFEPKPDVDEWVKHKLTDKSWAEWRKENPDFVKENASRFSV
jgi:hypothetical protein